MSRPCESLAAQTGSCGLLLWHRNWLLIGIGVILLLSLCAFFGGYGFWTLPGWLVVSAGVAGAANLACAGLDRGQPVLLRRGIAVFLVGTSCWLSFAPHVMLGILQGISALLTVLGIIMGLAGYFS